MPLFFVHGILSARFYARQKPISMENSMHTEHQNRKTRPTLDEAGFTLLEIIAVLVIMSILAVVAVPKYFDIQEQAREKAMGMGIAEAVGRVNGYFAQQVLNNQLPGDIEYSDTTLGTDLGDFTLSVTETGPTGSTTQTGTLNLTVRGKDGTPVENLTSTISIARPGL